MRWWFGVMLAGCTFAEPAQVDAPRRMVDGALPSPTLVAHDEGHDNGLATLDYDLAVPAGSNLLVLVSVQIGGQCTGIAPPTQMVTYGTAQLSRVNMVAGVPCSPTSTRSELWELAAPTVGSAGVNITLGAVAETIQSGALVFADTDAAEPLAASFSLEGGSNMSISLPDESAPGELVVSFIGQGFGIGAPLGSAQQVFLQDSSDNDTLDNSAASVTRASGSATTIGWSFTGFDDWQSLVADVQ